MIQSEASTDLSGRTLGTFFLRSWAETGTIDAERPSGHFGTPVFRIEPTTRRRMRAKRDVIETVIGTEANP